MKKKPARKPTITVAGSAGFCFGVRRAINLAEKTAQERAKVYTFGPLIHNPQEVRRLGKRGIATTEKPERLKDVTLILRTHGIPSELKTKLEKRALTLVDATCPFVKRAQDIIKGIKQEGVLVVIVGEETHPEVIGLVSYCKPLCRVVEGPEDVKGLPGAGTVYLVSQTTQTPENYEAVLKELKGRYPVVRSFNTICRATIDRQTEARKLAQKVDVMVVIGGKNSGNTRRLAQISGQYTPTYHIETADELEAAWFAGVRTVGLTAGASTPDWVIEDVRNRIVDFSVK